MSTALSAYLARFGGEEFSCGLYAEDDDLEVRLYSRETRPGFNAIGDGRYVRSVGADECEVIFYSLAVAQWRGLDCAICDEREGHVLLEYLGGIAPHAAGLGFDRVDRGVYRRWVPADELRALRRQSTFIKAPS